MIAWLADQDWCDGNVGMWGTSYSGFNSLQIAAERPPALKAVCAIYSSDDRWTDDVHWRGGALRLVDLVDYDHYMTPMTVLPPVPAVWGDGWRDEWRRRLETVEPWLLTWLRENRDGPYWRHGSLRSDGEGNGYDRIEAAVMLVAGWADGYRNNSFRTVAALREAGVPHRLLAGPVGARRPHDRLPRAAARPRRRDGRLVRPLAARRRTRPQDDRVEVFVRTATRPAAFLDQHEGYWVRDVWPSTASSTDTRALDGPRSLAVKPDVGTSAWIDCAGHLPWGLSGDQREDDAHSLTFEWPADGEVLVGHPVARLQVSADAPLASLSVKLCDVFPDGASALVTRGSLDLAFRDGVHAPAEPSPLVPGQVYDVVVDLDACAYAFEPGQTIRLSVAGADWPNTIAPPAPVTLTVHGGSLDLPLLRRSRVGAGLHPWGGDLLGGSGRRLLDHHPRRAAPDHDLLGAPRVDVRRPPRRHRHGGVRRRGRRRQRHLRPARHGRRAPTASPGPASTCGSPRRMRIDVGAEGYDVAIDVTAYDGDEQAYRSPGRNAARGRGRRLRLHHRRDGDEGASGCPSGSGPSTSAASRAPRPSPSGTSCGASAMRHGPYDVVAHAHADDEPTEHGETFTGVVFQGIVDHESVADWRERLRSDMPDRC